jgi:AraC-like DNA-binding protein
MNRNSESAFLEYFGDTPKLRFLDFLIGNHFFDFNMTDMAREANISYNSLKGFFHEFLNKGMVVKTRRVGKSDMYKLNTDNVIAQNFLKFAWFLTKKDLDVGMKPDKNLNVSEVSESAPSKKVRV